VGVLIGRRAEHMGNDLQHAGAARENVFVPAAENPPGRKARFGVAQVMLARYRMLSAIIFDDQPRLKAGRFADLGQHRELPAKAPA
jgi:hypothetical protein